METLGAERAAFIGLWSAFNSTLARRTVRYVCRHIGEDIWKELIYSKLDENDPKALERIFKKYLRQHLRIKEAVRQARFYGIDASDLAWSNRDRVYVGEKILNAILKHSGLFEMEGEDHQERYLALTEAAERQIEALDESLAFTHPYHLPKIDPPHSWDRFRIDRVPLITNAPREQIEKVDRMLRDGEIPLAVETISTLQQTPFRINSAILDLITWARANTIKVDGLPCEALPLVGDKRRKHEIRNQNLKNKAARSLLDQDLRVAEKLRDAPRFYIPLHLDFRGRVYPLPSLNYQRGDQIRALFEFAEGVPLGPDGLRELAIHVANTGDFGKTSKKPFEDRVRWTYLNQDLIEKVARDPKANRKWTEADKPFQFVAACREWVAAAGDPAYVSYLPIGKDGTNSGLQHYSAICRAEPEARLVNLVPGDCPQDIYGVVAEHVTRAIADDPSPKAKLWRDFEVDRKTVKRCVMTYLYGSNEYGFTNHLDQDLMGVLARQVLAGDRMVHPLEINEDGGSAAAQFLAKCIMAGIKEVAPRAVAAMDWTHKATRALAKEGQPVRWIRRAGSRY